MVEDRTMDAKDAPAPKFAHLHLHTHFSLLDGATRIKPLMERVKALGMPAVAITDHGNMFGVIEFYRAAQAAGVKPILGMEAYIAPGDRREKSASRMKEASYHLLLLAQDLTGYRNLLRLASIGYLEGFYYRPRIDKETLRELSEGIICTSTCLGAEIPQKFMQQDRAAAEAAAKEYLSIFGEERFFIELQDHGIPEQRTLNPELIDLAGRIGVPLIATNDVHYLDAGDVEAHDILCCISTGKQVNDESRLKFPSGEFYLKSPQQMAELFPNHHEALANTLRIVEMCNVELDFSKRYAPVYKVPPATTAEDELRRLVYAGAARKYGEIADELRERIDYELEVISSKGFSSYFLIVWDLMNFAREHNIPCGARGSGCSSVVAYCLNISLPDPIHYGLYFERFMDPDRDEMPDIDVDICQNGRADVINYVREKYGHVAQIITFGTLKARAAVKDVSRVLGLQFDEANRLTSMIPGELNMTIDKALAQEPDLRNRYQTDPAVKKVIDISRKLEGLSRHAGIHAAGVVVADQPLDSFLPLYKPANEDSIVTQFDGPTVEAVGLLKLDFLGLRTLTTLQRTIDLVQQHRGVTVDIERLDLEDQRVYQLFCQGFTKGVFQFESPGMRDVILRMRPNRIQDLIAANALYRPGPMEYIDDYVMRKHGRSWSTPHPVMTEVLEETYGIMVYQEQVSRLVNRLGGLELKRAFRLAKLISKKKTDQIAKQRPAFIEGCVANGLERATAEKVFEDILKFGGYAFNKAHSTGYALVAFQTACMKVYWPVEFMAALLTFEAGQTDKVHEYIDECKRMGISIAPPDVNSSTNDFTPDYRDAAQPVIRFGLSAIKGVGTRAVQAILDARSAGGAFASLYDFCERVDLAAVNRGVIEALICCGAFDDTGAMRKALMHVVDDAIKSGQRAQEDRRNGQGSLFGEMGADDGQEQVRTVGAEEWSESEMLAREKAVLGFYVTKHPLAGCAGLLEACATATTAELSTFVDKTEVVVGGLVTHFRTLILKKGRNEGKKMGIVQVEDLHGKTEVTLNHKELDRYISLIKLDSVLFFRGTVNRAREEASVRGDEVITAAEAPTRLRQSVMLRLDEAVDDEQVLERIMQVCQGHAGSCAVFLEVGTTAGEAAVIRCNNGMTVDASARCLYALADVIGIDRVICIGLRRKPIPWHEVIARETATPAPPVGATTLVRAMAGGAQRVAVGNF
jgi:DNA polymerase-3 subunit alpha